MVGYIIGLNQDEVLMGLGQPKSVKKHKHMGIENMQMKAIEKSIKKANRKNAKFIEHEKVVEWLKSWGSKEEKVESL